MVVARNDLECDAEVLEAGNGLHDVGFRRIKEDEKAQKDKFHFMLFSNVRLSTHVFVGDAERSITLAAKTLELPQDLLPLFRQSNGDSLARIDSRADI